MKAIDAKNNADEYFRLKYEQQLGATLTNIERASKSGKYLVYSNDLIDTVITKLKTLGYDVELLSDRDGSANYKIKWESIE